MQTGSIVWLKSGGPSMVVAKIQDDDLIVCTWHRPDGQLERAAFREAMLTHTSPGPTPAALREPTTMRGWGEWTENVTEKVNTTD